MKKIGITLCLVCVLFLCQTSLSIAASKPPKKLEIGVAMGIDKVTAENMKYAKSVDIHHIEIGVGALIDRETLTFTKSHQEILKLVTDVKKAADDAGINIWSIHMPFGNKIDLSMRNEEARAKTIELHKQVLEYVKILNPEIILFHPSFYLGLNEREERKQQLIKSAIELNKHVKSIDATMVIENMLGYELVLANGKRERPLLRTVEEAVEIMNRMPEDIYSAVDMNHIKNPEKLIRALGKRVKTVHVADGTGKEENHAFPCSGEGENNWVDIIAALDETGYSGPFMYESKYPDLKDLKACYDSMYQDYVHSLSLKK